jgi:hypothetical protein
MKPASSWRLEQLRTDYARATGKPFEHFFCPILLNDESVELCDGHIVPEAFGKLTIPQRKDVDNFYGTAAEADVIGFMQDKGTDVLANWHTPSIQQRFQPRIESADGELIGHYFPLTEDHEVPGQTTAELRDPEGKKIRTLVLKKPAHEVIALAGQDLQLVFEKNFMPAFTAAVLKAAHLSMFDMVGYDHVLSPGGRYLADVLGRFFIENKDSKNKREAVNNYFTRFTRMIFPMQGDGAKAFAGTVNDKRGIFCMGMNGRPFAIGCIVKMIDTFCALLPPDSADAIGTYQSFLKEPPPSIALREYIYCPGSETEQSHWDISAEDYRVEVPHYSN